MVRPMKENLKMINFQEMELILGQMDKNMLENGKIILEMDLENIPLLVAPHMKENIKMTKFQEMELSRGQMDKNILENLKMV